jgi:hypothetical protein
MGVEYSIERKNYLSSRMGVLVGRYLAAIGRAEGLSTAEIGVKIGSGTNFVWKCINKPEQLQRGSIGFYDKIAQNLGFEDVVDLIHRCRELELEEIRAAEGGGR